MNVVVPPLKALQLAGNAKPDGERDDLWVTRGYINFANAGKEKSAWAA